MGSSGDSRFFVFVFFFEKGSCDRISLSPIFRECPPMGCGEKKTKQNRKTKTNKQTNKKEKKNLI